MQLVGSSDGTVVKHVTVSEFGKPVNILVKVGGMSEANIAKSIVS